MKPQLDRRVRRISVVIMISLLCFGCGGNHRSAPAEKKIPRGYMAKLEIRHNGRVLGFGPFVGYYFAPPDPADLTRLRFVCLNERRFYTRDLPENAPLFEGEAVLTVLPDTGAPLPAADRINPIFPDRIPESWLATRANPRDEFRHFHSCYDAAGPVRAGYWLRHVALEEFTYDMGGRVGPESPLHHRVEPGPDRSFALIVEFDRGPAD